MKTRISVIGTGRMGSALVGAFLKEGHTTSAWNRTASKLMPLAARGAQIARSVDEAVSAADAVIVNVNDYDTADRLLRVEQVTNALRGKAVIQLTSGSPRQAREAADWARQHDIYYLDGAIMATPDLIGTSQCSVLYSGPSAVFDAHKPTLLALGGQAVFVGDEVGHASTLDLAMLTFVWGSLFGALQGAAVAQAEHFSLDAYVESMRPFMPLVNDWALDVMARIRDGRVAGDEHTPASIETHYGSLRHLLEVCRERGINSAVPDAFEQIFKAGLAAGRAKDDFAALTAFMR